MRSLLISINILIVSLCIPLFGIVYFTPWYSLNIASTTKSYIGNDSTDAAHKNLTQFFQHRQSLAIGLWSESEIIHMNDVRKIYDKILIIFVIALLGLIFLWEKTVAKTVIKRVMFVPLILLIILPFFSYFWSEIFHSVLFSNSFWITKPSDLSYYLFPLSFFIYSLIAISVIATLLNFTLYKVLNLNRNVQS